MVRRRFRPIVARRLLAMILAPAAAGQQAPPLVPDQTVAGQLRVDADGVTPARHALEVPTGTRAVRLELVCRCADLDLSVSAPDDDDAVWSAQQDTGREELTIDAFSAPPLRVGELVVEVTSFEDTPVRAGRRLDEVPYTLVARLVPERVDAVLEAGTPIAGRLDDASGRFRTYRIDAPATAAALRVDVVDADADVDLFLRRSPALDVSKAPFRAAGPRSRESLLVEGAAAAGTWYLDVAEPYGAGSGPTSFTVRAAFTADPADLPPPPAPVPAAPGTPMPRAAVPAVVQVLTPDATGSGTIVGADGIVLTNAHVVADLGEQPLAEAVVALCLDPALPPVEGYLARVVEFDHRLDLALLRIDRDLYGRPLPADRRFPVLPLRDPPAPLGEPLWVLGYPATGGTGSGVTITCSRGIVAGVERRDGRTAIKTDAEIHGGHSGGAAIDADGRLVAVPSQSIQDGINELNYLCPVAWIPADWRARWLAPPK